MDLFPAIDLREGKCVRLLQGDYDRQIDYHDDPLDQARLFADQGADWLHIVDLDGAREGAMRNREVIERIVSQTDLNVEVGGGVRDDQALEVLIGVGVKQVVVGTRALEDPQWFEDVVHRPEWTRRIVLGLDARNGQIATRGWMQTESMTVAQMAAVVNDWPLAAIVYTDIARDGMLTGPNIQATGDLARACRVPIIASGGVGELTDLQALCGLPLRGVIVGRALYENRFTVEQALATLKGYTD